MVSAERSAASVGCSPHRCQFHGSRGSQARSDQEAPVGLIRNPALNVSKEFDNPRRFWRVWLVGEKIPKYFWYEPSVLGVPGAVQVLDAFRRRCGSDRDVPYASIVLSSRFVPVRLGPCIAIF